MATVIKFDDNIEEMLAELKSTMKSVRARGQYFKGSPDIFKRSAFAQAGIAEYDESTGKINYTFSNITQFRKELKSVDPSARSRVVSEYTKFLKETTESNVFSSYKTMKDKFGQEVHLSVKDFMDRIDPEQAKRIRDAYKNFDYEEDDFTIVDFVRLAENSPIDLDELIDMKLSGRTIV